MFHERGGTWRGGFEERETAALRRVHRGVKRVGAPLNEKGQEASGVISQYERLPVEDAAIEALARAGRGAGCGDA